MTRRQFFVALFAPFAAAFAVFQTKSFLGVLKGKYKVYQDRGGPLVTGYKGGSVYDAGYIYCPYIPLYTTPLVVGSNFKTTFKTQYGDR